MNEEQFLVELDKFEPIIKAESHKKEIEGLEPDDIAQEVRIKLWLGYQSFDDSKSSFKTWANKVMTNCILNLVRDSNTNKANYLNKAVDIDDLDNE